jgi:hypothetical protein
MNNTLINYRDQTTVRRLGMDALKEKLGNVGAVYFIRQFNAGGGDYTKERAALHDELTFNDIVKESMEMDKKRTS